MQTTVETLNLRYSKMEIIQIVELSYADNMAVFKNPEKTLQEY